MKPRSSTTNLVLTCLHTLSRVQSSKSHRVNQTLVFGILLCATQSFAFSFGTSEMIIKFADDSVVAQPAIIDGYIQLTTSSGQVTLSDLPGVVELRHLLDPSDANRLLEGPYLVVMHADAKSNANIPATELLPEVEYIEDNPEDIGVIGDHAQAWFPPSSQIRFCDSQVQLHHRLVGDIQYPDEWCGWSGYWVDDHDMDMPQAWNITRGDESVLVAILDTGFDWMHPELGGDGPEFSCTPAESLLAFNNGVLYTNTNESLGDANQDGRPGFAYVDDDGDGVIDEDSLGRDYRNDPETDVVIGAADDLIGLTLYDYSANWTPGELVGRWLYMQRGSVTGYRVQVISNTVTTLTTTMINIGGYIYDELEDLMDVGWDYRVGDGYSNNETWADLEIDDSGWIGDLADDDDENGFVDDFHGYDFTNLPVSGGCPNEDYFIRDNNVFSHNSHGTMVASMLATSTDHGTMMGVAPNVTILPVRVGYGRLNEVNECEVGRINSDVVAQGVKYAMQFDPDIIVTAFGGSTQAIRDAFQAAVDEGVVYANGAGNDGSSTPHSLNQVQPSLMVAGLDELDTRWDNAYGATRYGEWIDVSARGWNLYAAKTLVNGVHTYGSGQYGTSLSGPIVGGIAALVKSAYPHMDRDEIIWMVERGVDPIDHLNPGYEGLLGTGRVNAFRALTMYGNCPAVATDTTWTGTVYVSGDVVVPAGKTLTIAPGTQILLADADILSSGQYANQIEFIVEGRIVSSGSAGSNIEFRSYAEPGSTWGPITFHGSTVEENRFEYTTFRNCPTALYKPHVGYRCGLVVDNCLLDTVTDGIKLNGMALYDNVTISNTTVTADASTGRGISITGYSGDYTPQIDIHDNVNVSGFSVGIYAEGGQGLSIYGVDATNCPVGILVVGGPTATAIGPNINLTGCSSVGLCVFYGSAIVQGINATDCGIGIYLSELAGLTTTGAATSITNASAHGLVLQDLDGDTVSNVTIDGTGDDGIRLTDCTNMTVTGVTVESASGSGIFVDDGDCELQQLEIRECAIGAYSFNTAYTRVRNCSFEYCGNGFACDPTGRANLGESGDYGNNAFFAQGSQYYAGNLNMSETLEMIGNCYNGGTNPKASRFLGAVNYLPAYCQ